MERIRRAGKKIRTGLEEKLARELPGLDEHASLKARLDSLDTGFRVLKVDSANFTDVYYQPDELTQDALSLQVDNLKRGRSPEDRKPLTGALGQFRRLLRLGGTPRCRIRRLRR